MTLGRKTKYCEEYCPMLVEHMAEGYSFESFAGIVGTCKQTIYNWLDDHEAFLDAKRLATAKCRVFWEKQGQQGVWNKKDKTLNSSVWIFNMKNRFGWRDKPESEEREVEASKLEIIIKDDRK